jgi:putative spermidine/putrescine transport system permease protein
MGPGALLRRAAPYVMLAPALAFMAFIACAAGFLVRYSFDAWNPDEGMVSGWTISSYLKFFETPYFFRALASTVRLAAIVTGLAVIMGYPVAYLMSVSSRYRNLIMVLIIVPLMMDIIVRAYGWIVLLSAGGLVNSVIIAAGLSEKPVKLIYTQWAVIAELLHESLAFMVLPIAGVLQKINPSLAEASATLGGSQWRTFRSITLPLSLPGVFAGTLLVFALGMSAFVGPLILGGGNITVMSLIIRDQMGVVLDWPLGSAMSVVLVALTLVLLFLYGRLMHPQGRLATGADRA